MEIAYLKDTMYPKQSIDHTRITVRAFVEDAQGKFVFLKIKGLDEFGQRNCIETSGGGVENDESLIQALNREMSEELGFCCKVIQEIGSITDFYHLIHRKTISHYFWVKCIQEDQEMQRTETELASIEDVLRLDFDEIDTALNPDKLKGVNYLCQRRDFIAFQVFKKIKKR